jgi:Uncharacterized vancomycin resistance protein
VPVAEKKDYSGLERFGGEAMRKFKNRTKLVYKMLLLTMLLMALGWLLYDRLMPPDEFLSDVQIGGIDVGGYNQTQAVAALDQALTKMKSIPVSFYKDDYIYEAQLGDLIVPFDTNSVVESAWQDELKRKWYARLVSLNTNHKVEYTINLAYNPEKVTELLQAWGEKWARKVKDASLEMDSKQGLIVIQEQAGIVINESATFQTLPATLAESGEIRLPILVERQEPKVTTAMLQNIVELSSYTTYYNANDVNRSHNLSLAAASINKSLVKPEEVFSFNSTVGPRNTERGYLDAKVIVGNKFESGLGGGICQVSSTLYNAVLLTAGLKIIERNNHNLVVTYVPMGRDATVVYGSQDFKFENNTGAPVYIRSISMGGKLTIFIYGDIRYKQKIEITNVIDQTLPFHTITQSDPTLQPGQQIVVNNGQPGYIVRAFRSFYDTNGKVITTEQMSQDIYQPLNKLILAGPEIVPSEVPAPATDLP